MYANAVLRKAGTILIWSMHQVPVMRIADEDENTKCMQEPEAKEVLHTHFKPIFHFKLFFSDTVYVTYSRSSIGFYRC